MTKRDTDQIDDERSRRRFLAAIGTGGTFALAGCSGGDGGDGSDSDGGDGESPATETDPTTEGGEGQVCPSPPFSYSSFGAAFPMTEDTDPLVTFEASEGDGFTATIINQQWNLEYGPPRNRLSVRPERMSGTVAEQVDADTMTDLSDQYDVPEGARVVTGASPEEVILLLRVLLPTSTDGEFVNVRISLTSTENCPEVADTVQDRIVNSVTLA
jgi:hypothetical protein